MTEVSPPRRTSVGSLVAVGALALAVRVVYLVDSLDIPSFGAPIVDAGAYDTIARALATGEGLDPRLFWQPFLYPVLLAAIYAPTGGSIVAARLVQALLGAATCCLAAALGTRVADRRIGLTAGVVTALYGPLVLFEGELLATGWATFWGILATFLFTLAGERFRPGLAASLGVVSAAALLTRPTVLPFLATAWLWLALRALKIDGPRRSAATVALGLAGFLPLAVPVAHLAARTIGSATILPTSGGLNAYIGNNADPCTTLTIRPGDDWGDLVGLPLAAGYTTLPERDRFFRRRVVAFAREQPLAFARGLAAKSARLLNSRELPRNFDPYLYREWSPLLRGLMWKLGSFGFPFGLLLPLAVVGLARHRGRFGVPLVLYVGLSALAVILVFVAARYRVPLVPALAVFAAAGFWALADDVRQRRWKRLLAAAGAAMVVASLSALPPSFCEETGDLASEYHVTLGFARSERGDVAGAIASYERALERGGERADVHYNLGLLHRERGAPQEAIEHFERAIALDPAHARAANNLGALLEAERRLDEAERLFQRAAELAPDHAAAHRNLGNVRLQAGRAGEALMPLRRALELEPAHAETLFLLGGAMLQNGDPSGAVGALEQAVRLADNPRFHNELGTALIAAGRPAEAVTRFEAAIALAPDYVDPYTNAGAAAAIAGDLEVAIRFLRQGLEIAPDNADTRYNLAVLLLRSGRTSEAQAELENVLSLVPRHPQANRLLAGTRR